MSVVYSFGKKKMKPAFICNDLNAFVRFQIFKAVNRYGIPKVLKCEEVKCGFVFLSYPFDGEYRRVCNSITCVSRKNYEKK